MCHGSDICSNDWDEVQASASAAGTYGWVIDLLSFLLMIGTMVLIIKKHVAGLNIIWKLLAVVPLLMLIQPILQAAVSNPALMTTSTGNQVAGLPSPIFLPHLLPFLYPPTPLSSWCLLSSTPTSSPPLLPPFTRYSFTSWLPKTRFAP